jgi:hypothetical protein
MAGLEVRLLVLIYLGAKPCGEGEGGCYGNILGKILTTAA